MLIARIAAPVFTLGPGARTAVWFSGCKRRCPGCANPELWTFDSALETTAKEAGGLILAAAGGRPGGFTITGGEPFDQPEGLAELVGILRGVSEDILVYTGYSMNELRSCGNEAVAGVLSGVAALIDGPYIDERNTGAALRGSANQELHILNASFRGFYEAALASSERRIQNIPVENGFISVGIHKRQFRETLEEGLGAFGLEET